MKNTIQTKRNTRKKTGFRKLHARTTSRKRKLRASTAVADPYVDLESDVPNVGVGRALIVILVVHVVVIAAIYAHSTFFGDDAFADADAQSKASKSPIEIPGATAAALVAPEAENVAPGRHIVVSGDTYAKIAMDENVDPTDLRTLNGNRALRGGDIIDLPPQLSTRPVAVRQTPVQRSTRSVATAQVLPEPKHARAIVIDEEPVARANRSTPKAAPMARPVASTMTDSGKRYTVKSGDTVWRIAHNHKVKSDQLLKINGIKDASKLKIGRVLVIPTR